MESTIISPATRSPTAGRVPEPLAIRDDAKDTNGSRRAPRRVDAGTTPVSRRMRRSVFGALLDVIRREKDIADAEAPGGSTPR
jgi:hypothetical protein